MFDDFGNILDNASIRITHLSLDSLESSLKGPAAGPLGRPVSVLSLALTYYFFGLDPFAFKAVNLAIHLLNGVWVAWLTVLLLRAHPDANISPGMARWLPIWVAAIWLLHPIHHVAIILSVQRMALLSTMFMQLALISHLQATAPTAGKMEARLWLMAGWLVFWPLAVFSKETGLLFPLFVLLIEIWQHGRTGRQALRRGYLAALILLLMMLAIVGAMLSYLGVSWLDQAYAMRDFSLAERLMTEARVLWFYIGQIVTPAYTKFGFYLDDFPLSTGWLSPSSTLFAVLGWILVVLGLAYGWRRWPMPCFAMTWYLLGHSLESTFLPLELAQEYRNYLPSIGLILGVGYTVAGWLQKFRLDHRAYTFAIVAVLPVIVLALFTWLRSNQWGDTLRGTQLEAAHHPHSARANYSAAQALFAAGHGDAADPIGGQMIRYHFTQATAASPSNKLSLLGALVWACASGRPIDESWIRELSRRLEYTAFAPKDLELPSDLLRPLIKMPDCLPTEEVIALFEAGSRNSRIPISLRAAFLDAEADYLLLVAVDPNSAKTRLDAAVRLSPENFALRRKQESFAIILGRLPQ